MQGSRAWSSRLIGAGLVMTVGLATVAASAGVEDPAVDSDGATAFRRLVATASMRFPDDPTMRALILREADPVWSDSFSEMAALELSEGAVPLIRLLDPPGPVDALAMDEATGTLWCEFGGGGAFARIDARTDAEFLVGGDPPDHLLTFGDYARLDVSHAEDATDDSFPWASQVVAGIGDDQVRAGVIADGRVAVAPAVHRGNLVGDHVGCASGDDDPRGIWGLAWSPSGRFLACRRWGDGDVVSVIDLSTALDVRDVPPVNGVPVQGWGATDVLVGTKDGRWIEIDPIDGRSRVIDEVPMSSAFSMARPCRTAERRLAVEVEPSTGMASIVDHATGSHICRLEVPRERQDESSDRFSVVELSLGRVLVGRQLGGTMPADDWVVAVELDSPDTAVVLGGLDNLGMILPSPDGITVLVTDVWGEQTRLWRPFDPESSPARVDWYFGRGACAAWNPDGRSVARSDRYGPGVQIHDADWSLRRQKLWDRIPAVLTPMQRMQYLGESPEVARRTWKAQMQRNR
jgi:hypothetical protein